MDQKVRWHCSSIWILERSHDPSDRPTTSQANLYTSSI